MRSSVPTLKICLFGAMSVEVDGVEVSGGLARKEFWLLALLALRAKRAMPRAAISSLLWPDCEEEQALYNLRRSLTRLRSALGNQADCIQQVKPRSLVFAAPEAWVDALYFDQLMASEEPGLLAEAVDLCRGTLLQNCYQEWAQAERLPREFAYQKALETLAQHALAQGDWLEAEKYCRLHIAANPLHEPAYRLLMQALARNGNQGAAMQAFRDLRVRLRAEINADPDPATLACYQALRQSAKHSAASSRVTLAQTRSPNAYPLPSPSSVVSSLPQPLTRLIGRELDVVEICHALSGARLVTLLGAGGVGKTRLAIEIAHREAKRFADGTAFVELASVSDATAMERAVARALGIAEKPAEPLLMTLTQSLQTQKRLLSLDNCEHLRIPVARLANALLAACPHLHILATSRQALGLPGETVWRVPSLPTPPFTETRDQNIASKIDDVLEYPAVQLFLERVVQTSPEFRLSPSMLPSIAQICHRLDGIPLAIELAAYRVRALSPEKIAARLADRFHLLTGGGTASLPRQQTLRALIDWSYQLLEPDEKQLFARLSVFAGGWTLEAAESVCGGGDVEEWGVMDLLTSLVDKSLVAYSPGAVGRYFFLESIREYARERLHELGDPETCQRKYADYFAEMAVETEPRLLGPEQGELQQMLDREHENMRAVLSWGRENTAGALPALRIASRLWRFWMQRGYWREGREHLHAVLYNPHTPNAPELRCRVLNGAGMLAYRMGDFNESRRLQEANLALSRQMNDERAIAVALGNLGHVPAAQGQWEEARLLYAESLAIQRRLKNDIAIAYGLLSLGNIAVSQHQLTEACAQYEESLTLFRRLGDKGGELLTLGNLGHCSLMQDDAANAIAYCEQALALCRELPRPEAESLYLPTLGGAYEQMGDAPRALQCFHEALRNSLRLGDKRTLAATLATLAAYYLRREEYEEAARYYGCSDAGYAVIGMQRLDWEQQNELNAHDTLREHLGEAGFKACFCAGQQLTMESLAREALQI